MAWRDKDKAKFSEDLLESENDRLIEGVASKVSSLKHLAVDLRSETKDQVTYMDNSAGIFESAASLLGGTFKRVQNMNRSQPQNCKYMCYFTLAAAIFFFVAYFLINWVMSS